MDGVEKYYNEYVAAQNGLKIREGALYVKRSENNRLRNSLVFGERGVIYDRNGKLLAWNEADPHYPEFSKRTYIPLRGLSHVLGYVKYPSKDSAGFYYKVDFEGMDGVEKYYNEYVAAQNGLKIVETDALGVLQSESVLRPPKDGESIYLSIDARLQEKLYGFMETLANEKGFEGGAGVFIDAETGEILTLASFPEYNSQILSDGADGAAIKRFLSDNRKPFLDRATGGLYTPGSIVKPFLAIGALEEKVITPEKKIFSSGSISVPNPYDPTKFTVFNDWKIHGDVDMRRAIAISSDVYFYEIGGGFKDQLGLGIGNIEKYMRLFGFGAEPGDNPFFGLAGIIPNPAWKEKMFAGDPWRIGDTYHTAIGQYGVQVTVLQAARAAAAVANGGKLLEPRILHEEGVAPSFVKIPASPESFRVAREGMKLAVSDGTAKGLQVAGVTFGAKTGTAELGTKKKLVNSWIVGFFPFEKPRYAFAILMEKGPSENTVGALFAAREFIEWMSWNTPEYFGDSK